MIAFLLSNLANILIGGAILAAVIWIAADILKKRKKGTAAGCGNCCSGCPGASLCHKTEPPGDRE